ncbi:MAG: metal ABC transporter permease [Bacillota bacterium]|nr:metal ABC transporter permease [Bacillota bacterium]
MLEYLVYPFMQKAILAAILGGASCGAIGVVVLLTGITLLGTTISHAALAGALLGLLLGFNPVVTAFAFAIGVSLLIGPLADWGKFKLDTALGIIFSATVGLVFLLLGLLPGSKSEGLALLWGNILLISHQQLILMVISTLVALGFIVLFFKEIQALILGRELAIASGIPATRVFYMILVLTGVVITSFYTSFGAMLIFTLIINPAAAAYQLTYNLKHMFLLAMLFGVVSTLSGLTSAAYLNIPAGAATVLASVFLLAGTLAFSKK